MSYKENQRKPKNEQTKTTLLNDISNHLKFEKNNIILFFILNERIVYSNVF